MTEHKQGMSQIANNCVRVNIFEFNDYETMTQIINNRTFAAKNS